MKYFYLISLVLLAFTDNFAQTHRISAVGSSTTGGSGAFPADSAYVRRLSYYYKNQLGIIDTAHQRAVGGYNCYKGMPTGYVPPVDRPGPDPNNNITRALADLSTLADPADGVIIINYPTNDYQTYTFAEIMFCLQTMYNAAVAAGHKCFVTTTQPRQDGVFATSAVKRKLADLKDSIINRFGVANTLNFWDGMYNPADTTILAIYSAGDNIHFNNTGHRILFERVVAKNVFGMALPVTLERFTAVAKNNSVQLEWTAHHDKPNTWFTVQRSSNGIQFESLGNIPVDNNGRGNKLYRFTDDQPGTGTLYYRLEIHEEARKQYSSTVSVKMKDAGLSINRIYPTRVSQTLTLELISPISQTVTLEIINSAGARLKVFTRSVNKDKNTINLPVGTLSPGSYFLRILSPDTAPVVQSFVK